MKMLNILLVSSLLIVVGIIYVYKNDKPFFPSEVARGVLVCHDPIANRQVFIPFEKFPRVNNNWIEVVDEKENKVVLTSLHCVITYEPKAE